MTKPVRIQLSRVGGFRLQAHSRSINGLDAVKVDRTTPLGNPYRIGETVDLKQMRRWSWNISPKGRLVVCGDAIQAVMYFRHALLWDSASHNLVRRELRGHNVACWCGLEDPCHGDPLMWLANSTEDEVRAIQDGVDNRIFRMFSHMDETPAAPTGETP